MTTEKPIYDKLCEKIAQMREKCSAMFDNWHIVEKIALTSSSWINEKKGPILLEYLSNLDKLINDPDIEKLFNATKEAMLSNKMSEESKKAVKNLSEITLKTIHDTIMIQAKNIITNMKFIIDQ